MFEQSYPKEDPNALVLDETEYAVQVNSRIVCKTMVENGLSNEEIEAQVKALPEIGEKLAGKEVKKCIVVPGRLVNLIVG